MPPSLKFLLLAISFALPLAASAAPPQTWLATWGTSQPMAPPVAPKRKTATPNSPADKPSLPTPLVPVPPFLSNQTVRMLLRTSAGGDAFRLEFSNARGSGPLELDAVHLAASAGGPAIDPSTDRIVTFGGKRSLRLLPGGRAISDPIPIILPALSELAVSIHVAAMTATSTTHALGLSPVYIVSGNATADQTLDHPALVRSYFWLSGIDVRSKRAGGTIVALGDSITDGFRTSPGRYRAWPDLLARRLARENLDHQWGVVNAGISGNRVLKAGTGEAAIERFDSDVLARAGVRWVMVLEGINDINDTINPALEDSEDVTAQEIIDGLDQIIVRAHLHGIKVAGCTILPTKGLPFYSERGESMRQTINAWIRTSGRFDAVIDFDAVVRDPEDPRRLLPAFDPGDHVHPNDDGNQAMANAIDLALFR